MKYRYDPPWLIKKFYNGFHWNTSNGKLLLTFDDGPNPQSTPLILDLLDKYSIKSLFFCVGQNLERYPEIASRIVNAGHQIGNHTYSHKNIRYLNPDSVADEIGRFNQVYQEIFATTPAYFRPPYGRFKIDLRKSLHPLGMQNVMWSLLTYDYKNDLNILKFAVTNYLSRDSIIVLHDSIKSLNIIREAIEFIYSTSEDRRFEFGEPSECLRSYS